MRYAGYVFLLSVFLLAASCGFFALIPESPVIRSNPDDPWLDPFSVFVDKVSEAGATGFGEASAMYGDLLVVGAPDEDVGAQASAGKAYIYRRDQSDQWNLVETLESPSPETDGVFGHAVAIHGTTIVVGAPHETVVYDLDATPMSWAGNVYMFDSAATNVWTLSQTFNLNDSVSGFPIDNDKLGEDIVFDGTWLLIGANGDDLDGRSAYPTVPPNNFGAVYVLQWAADEWVEVQRLDAGADARSSALFGRSIHLSANRLIVGAPNDPIQDVSPYDDAGAAYIFEETAGAWSLQSRVISESPADFQGFGWSVHVDGDTAAVGAPFVSVSGNSAAGTTYVIDKDPVTGWPNTPSYDIQPSSPTANGYFGIAVALAEETLLIGAAGMGTAGVVWSYALQSDVYTSDASIEPADATSQFGNLITAGTTYAAVSSSDGVYIYTSN